jgi:hypothetical protein
MRILPVIMATAMFCGNIADGRKRPLEMDENPRTLFNNCEDNALPWIDVDNFHNGGKCPPSDSFMKCTKGGKLYVHENLLHKCKISDVEGKSSLLQGINKEQASCLIVEAADVKAKAEQTVQVLEDVAPKSHVLVNFKQCLEVISQVIVQSARKILPHMDL